ncbi:MAG: B12-binding domain-containing radical SAM protein [Chromatiaceae bacterium]|nr:B12-binding domain-containing radical SAM protein [Chromatiaceae bacterium]MCP5313918.1 B12-binding domain-containing radical SAM protein [Chromatiaceae bacterium]
MKIALISAKGPLYRHRGGIFKKSLRYQPLTLTTLAALVPPELHAEVVLYDEGIEDVPSRLDVDLVGLTVITGTAPRSYALADHYRRSGITVVLGGPHVTLLPDEAARHADSIVTGYAEQTWPQLLRDHAAGRLQPRYRQAADFTLDQPVFPARHLFDARRFLTQDVFEATRSCNHDCDFCVAPSAWGRRPYQKPVEHVIEDIRRQGARKLIFIDLNLIADRRYAAQLFEALIPLKVRWFGLSTMLIAHDRALLKLMARSGCSGLLIGFESISPNNLDSAHKRFNDPGKYKDVVALLHRHGISVMGCFVFGLDDDTEDVFERTAEFVVEACIDLPRFAIATPFPGTPFFDRLHGEGRILTRDWELYDGQHVVFQPKQMSVDALRRGHEAAWRHAYRYRSIARRLFGARIQLPIAIASNLGYRFYAHHLHDFYNCDWVIGQRSAAA